MFRQEGIHGSRGSGTEYADKAKVTLNGDLVLYAQWDALALTVSSIADQTWTGQAITPTVTVKAGNTTLTLNTDYAVAYKDNTNAGTATVTVTGKGDYKDAKAVNVTFKIVKADSSVTSAPAAKTLTYNGKAQELVEAGKANGGTMQYAIGKDDKTVPTDGWKTSIPTATEAGTYYVWYKVIGDSNHNDCDPKCVCVTISAAGSPDNHNPENQNTNNQNADKKDPDNQNPGKKDPNNQDPGKKDPNNGGNNQGGGNRKDKKTEKITISKRPSSVKAKAKKNKVTVSWKKIKKNKAGKKLLKQINSIQIQYSTDKAFKQNVKTKTVGKKKTKVTLKVQKKTTYYIRVRYKGSNGFSTWSKVKKVKTKK